MYVVFARKYRPQRFEDLVGQDHIARALQNAIRTERVAHAYLFCGSRGVGKTTTARLLAKGLNCKEGPTPEPCCECESCRRIAVGEDMDVLEIDGASTRGIDAVRELRQNVRLIPAHSRFKVYYIDEVHMLTPEAFNALLKTLEEPPSHVKFIFSTTDPQRIPETVRSRCQRFDFRRVSDADMVERLQRICEQEGLEVEEGGLAAIARAARGSLRDSLGALDQVAALGETAALADVLTVLGAVDRTVLVEIVDALAAEDTAGALRAVHRVLFEGTDVEDFADQLCQHLRDVLVAGYCRADDPMLAGAFADAETLERQSKALTADQLTYMIQVLREARQRARRDTTGRLALELAVIKISRLSELVRIEDALGDLDNAGGNPGPKAATVRPHARKPGPAPAPGNDAAVGAIRTMRNRVAQLRRTGAAPAGAPQAVAERTPPPEGVSDTTWRKLTACADDPKTARDMRERKALMDAFAEGDRVLGLEPVRLERRDERELETGPAEETLDAEESD